MNRYHKKEFKHKIQLGIGGGGVEHGIGKVELLKELKLYRI